MKLIKVGGGVSRRERGKSVVVKLRYVKEKRQEICWGYDLGGDEVWGRRKSIPENLVVKKKMEINEWKEGREDKRGGVGKARGRGFNPSHN